MIEDLQSLFSYKIKTGLNTASCYYRGFTGADVILIISLSESSHFSLAKEHYDLIQSHGRTSDEWTLNVIS